MEVFKYNIDRNCKKDIPMEFMVSVINENIVLTRSSVRDERLFKRNVSRIEPVNKCVKNIVLFIVSLLQENHQDDLAKLTMGNSIQKTLDFCRLIDRLGQEGIKRQTYIEFLCQLHTFLKQWVSYCSLIDRISEKIFESTAVLIVIFFSLRSHIPIE